MGKSEIRVGRTRIRPDSEVLFGLLLYLGLNVGESVSRERILELLWPAEATSDRRHALRQLLYRLRQVGAKLERSEEGLRLATSQVESDIAGLFAPDWPERAKGADIIAAAELLPGYDPPLSEPFRDWLDALRARAGKQYRLAVDVQIARARGEGRWVAVEEWSRRCLAVDALNQAATLACAEATAMTGADARAMDILDEYVGELGEDGRTIGMPAKVLRKRISEKLVKSPPASATGWQFVGRENEMTELNRLLLAAGSGSGSTVALVGPPGIGKTRLAHEFFGAARLMGVAAASVRLQAKDSTRAMALFTELVPQLLSMRGALGCAPETLAHLRRLFERPTNSTGTQYFEAEELRQRTRFSLAELFDSISDEQPLLLLVDNVQHLDDVSRDLMVAVMSNERAMWLLSSPRALRQVLPSLATPTHEIRLGVLTPEAATTLFRSAVPTPTAKPTSEVEDWCYRVSGGNPLYLNELIHHWIHTGERESVPRSLREIVRSRLARLTNGALRTLQLCAVLGNNASIGLLVDALASDATSLYSSLEELETHGLLVGRGDDALAVHDLVAAEALGIVAPALLSLFHFRAGTALEATARVSWAPQIAWDAATHLSRAGESNRALRLLRECARHFLEIGLPSQAATILREGRRYTRTTSTRLELLSDEVLAMRHAGDWPGIIRTVAEVREVAKQSGDLSSVDDELVLVHVEASWYLDGNIAKTLEEAMGFIRRPSLPLAQLARAANLAMILADNMCLPDLMDEIHRAISTIANDGEGANVNLMLVRGMHATAFGRFAEGAELFRNVALTERERGSVWALSRSLRHWSVALRRGGNLEDAMRLLLEAYRVAGEHGLSVSAACSADAISGLYFERKEFGESRRWLDRGLESNGGTGARVISRSLDNQRLKLSAHSRERPMDDEEVLDYADRVLIDSVVRRRNEDLAALIYWGISRPNLERVTEYADRLGEGLRQSARLSPQHYWHAAYLTALCATGEFERAKSLAAEHGKGAAGHGTSLPWYLRDALDRCSRAN